MTSSEVVDHHAWIVLVTGMSGSGKTTAVRALEDQGFFCIDNLPPSLARDAVDACLAAHDRRTRIALVLDARSGQFIDQVPDAVATLRAAGHTVEVVFLDASDEVLIRRFSETRRRHPLDATTLTESLLNERRALIPLRALATRVVDTSAMNVHELTRAVSDGVSEVKQGNRALSVTFISFGFKYGLPVEADMVFDVRHLKNPHFVPELKAKTGLDSAVSGYVLQDPAAGEFLNRINDLLRYLLPLYRQEGKRYLTVAIGCTGGKHRSVTMAEALNKALGHTMTGNGPESSGSEVVRSVGATLAGITLAVRHRDAFRDNNPGVGKGGL